MTARQHRKRLVRHSLADASELIRGVFDVAGDKEGAGVAVAVIQEGIMDIECCLGVGKMLFAAAVVADGGGNR